MVGGDLALDFVNTAEERGHPAAGDALLTPDDLRVWGVRSGVLRDVRITAGARGELQRAREARELLYGLFLARVREEPPEPGALRRLRELVATAFRAGELVPAEDGALAWHWDPGALASVRHRAVAAGLTLLSADLHGRLRQCPGEHCGWFFLDVTRRGNRRWCEMGECGQDAKVARRRARAHSAH